MAETMDVDKIGMDVPVQEVYPSFVERYFIPRYVIDVHSRGDDMCVLFHSNRACLITLAPSHPVLAENKKLIKVDFEAEECDEDIIHLKRKHRNERTNRMENRVRGKKKKGAQILHRRSLLCKIECEDGSIYSVRSGIPGVLVEINEELIKNPNLLTEKPSSEGYIAIILPKTLESDRLRDKLMTPHAYKEALEERAYRENVEITDEEELDAGLNEVEPNGKKSDVKVEVEEDCTAETGTSEEVEPKGVTSEV